MPLRIGNFHPDRGKPRDLIRITGEGFVPGTRVIFFQDRDGYDVTVRTAEELTVRVPEVAETGVIHLQNPNGERSSSSSSFTVEEPPIYITNLKPTSGEVGEQITIMGHGFDLGPTRRGTVKFGTYSATQINWSSDIIVRATIPATAKPGKVYIEVTTHRGTARSPQPFTIT
ncbi:IPT/TIG domain-containing protein [Nonomuraea sediminis]|uniref:IPT/TIG domain-containing protein n=1 Tax=Nonomuraea sediminis TaxID=2835864 RepID=UPI001BDD5B1A|nr:IPT/TIG domain-containing protein [Nonomuraea sediminis]